MFRSCGSFASLGPWHRISSWLGPSSLGVGLEQTNFNFKVNLNFVLGDLVKFDEQGILHAVMEMGWFNVMEE